MAREPFLWGAGGRKMTPEQVDRERTIAQALMTQASDTSPVGHWTAALNRGLQGYLGGRQAFKARSAEDEGIARAEGIFSGLMGGAPSAGVSPVAQALAGGGMSAPSGADAEAIRAGLIARGLPEHVADGFLMNFQDESGLRTDINEIEPLVPGSRGGFGLAQWTGPRRRQLEAFAQQRGVPVSDLDVQLDFLMTELQGPEAAAAQRILSAQNAGEAGAAIVNDFLRPSPEYRQSRAARYLGGAGGISPVVEAQAAGPSSQTILAAMADPWVAQQYGPVIQALASQAGQRENAIFQQQLQQADPMYQAQLAQMTAPAPSVTAEREAFAAAGGLQPGTPEYANYILTGQLPQASEGFTLSPGQQRFDAQGNVIASGQPDPGFQMVTPEEVAALGLEPGAYQRSADGRITQIGGGGTTVNVDVGAGGKFEEAFAKGDAATIDTVYNAGLQAQRNIGRIDQLDALLQSAPTGAEGALKLAAGELGINTSGLSDIQAAQAMINSLVPEQRQPGSGPMSDADLALFKQSLPRIINQPGGNRTIIQTMKAIAQYDAEGAQIVQRLRAGEIDRAQAFDALQNRQNPLDGIKAVAEGGAQGGAMDFTSMAPADILAVDIMSLTPDQFDAYEEALKRVQQ